jgi:23S rRNA (pseudouridine1915-N3)-methyltransferase
MIGKTADKYLKEGMDIYIKRLIHYCDFSMEILPDIKNGAAFSTGKLKEAEAEVLLKKISDDEYLVLLDENGKQLTSVSFSKEIESWGREGKNNVAFVIGGAYGFGESLLKRAKFKMSLSTMTFSHQMVRLIFLEQLYRAFSIIRREPYHHH